MVVAKHKNVLVQLVARLFIQRKQVVLSLNLTLCLKLLSQLLLFSTWSPNRCRFIVWVTIWTAHPLKAPQLLIVVRLVVILVLLFLFLLLSSLCTILTSCLILAARCTTGITASFRRLLAFRTTFLALSSGVMGSNLL